MNTFGLKLSAKYTGLETRDKHESFAWACELSRANRRYTFPFYQGLAHCKRGKPLPSQPREVMTQSLARAIRGPYGKLTVADCEGYVIPTEPTLKSVLYCLQSDAQAGDHLLFEDFASDLGYDPDSRKAEATWRACQAIRGELRKLLGEEFEAFMSEDFDCVEPSEQAAD
jgi:hypothetical protein